MFKQLCLSTKNSIKKDYPEMSNSDFEKHINTNMLIEALITDILEDTKFEGICIDGINYYELYNKWQSRDISKYPYNEQEKQIICNAYMDEYCDHEYDTKIIPFDSKWNFLINYGEKAKDINKKLFDNETSIRLVNISGINYDHRGSNHFMYDLPHNEVIILDNPTLGEFINAIYLIKSHKTDNWYELFDKVQLQLFKSLDDIDVNDKNNKLSIKLKFDHGS